MIDNDKYPNPNVVCYNSALSAIVNINNSTSYNMDIEQQDDIINEIIELMDNNGVKPSAVTCDILMNISLQQRNIDKLFMYYNKYGVNTRKQVVKMSNYALKYYQSQQERDDDKMSEFKSWAIKEYEKSVIEDLPLLDRDSAVEKYSTHLSHQM